MSSAVPPVLAFHLLDNAINLGSTDSFVRIAFSTRGADAIFTNCVRGLRYRRYNNGLRNHLNRDWS